MAQGRVAGEDSGAGAGGAGSTAGGAAGEAGAAGEGAGARAGGAGVRARSFGAVAAEYDRVRPGYPSALVDAVLEHCGGPGAAALEVGAGTGKATAAFAGRGLRITAVEPDPAMAEVLARNCAAFPGVTVTVSTFEKHRPAQPAGLLFSAQAWHWTDPATRWERAAAALAPGGTLALFWNHDHIPDRGVDAAVARAHRDIAPQIEWDCRPIDERSLMDKPPGPELAGSTSFTGAHARLLRWERPLSRQDYLDFLGTHSLYLLLDAGLRAALFARVARALPDPVMLAEETALYLARRAPA